MCQPLLQRYFHACQQRRWGCSHDACIRIRILFLLYKSKNIEGHVYISPDAPCFPATLTAAIQCLKAEHNYTIERYWKSCSISMRQPLLQQQFNAWQERHWGCSHCACILYSLSHKHRWWGGMVIWDVDGGMGWVVDGGGVVFYLLNIGFIAGYCRWPRLWTWCERSWSFRTLGLLAVQVVGPGTFTAPFKSDPCSTLTALFGHFYSIRGLVLLQH